MDFDSAGKFRVMLQFHQNAAVRNYFSRREQRRLWIWVLAIGVPILIVSHFLEQWLVRPSPKQAQAAPIDTRIAKAVSPTHVPGSFLSPAGSEIEPELGEEGFFPSVKPELLQTIRDDTPSRGAEHGIFFNLLEVLARTSDDQLQAASQGNIAYVQLFRQPEVYRGKLVSLSGTVRRAYRLPLTSNEFGADHYYQLWIQPKGAPKYPVVVYCLELPSQFELGEALDERVSLTGFFFKRWAYESKGGTMTAPMLLAKTLHREKPVADAVEDMQGFRGFGWLTFTVALCIAGLVAATVLASKFVAKSTIVRPVADRDRIEALRDEPQVDIKEELERLAREGD